MNQAPLVTVVIPTYNDAGFLREALQSLCAQNFSDWEAIVVNNYSEDDTILVVESFSDPRIRLENFSNNGVIAASRNTGIALARGCYIAFLDSDDTWYPDKLTRCIPYFDKGADLVCHGLRTIGDHESDMYCGPQQRATFDALLDKGSCITPSATLVRKEILESVGCFSEDPSIVTAEDYHLWLKLAKVGISMLFIKEILGEYRFHTNNQSGSVLRHMDSALCVIREFMPVNSSSNLETHIRLRRRLGLAYYGAGRAMQKRNRLTEPFPLFFRSLAYWPFYSKTYAALVINILSLMRPLFSK